MNLYPGEIGSFGTGVRCGEVILVLGLNMLFFLSIGKGWFEFKGTLEDISTFCIVPSSFHI